ncbi:uncharacterized protein LOC119265383 [Pygocentrus nattereri]|uniref:uncharacterized protein LOC119265383 n=1 Tax=Pygocentrus nattereri TaxID=42514 RepID=UPI0018918C96|nr:uncharacterized protein LOC119265383 [Pygocentrus nattereri]
MALSKWSDFFKQHPYSSSVLFSLVLVVLEKVVEVDFVCPCESGYTEAFFSFYLLVPMFIAFVFGLYLLSFKCSSCGECCSAFPKLLACAVPSVVWLAMFLCDGRYIACLYTELKKDYIDSANPSPWKWCEKNQTLTAGERKALKSFYVSKLLGFIVLILISSVALIYKFCKKGCKYLDFTDQEPRSSAHCRACCEHHKPNCSSEHRDMNWSDHLPEEDVSSQGQANTQAQQEGMPLRQMDSTAASPCAKTDNCPCLCHQTCRCDGHQP